MDSLAEGAGVRTNHALKSFKKRKCHNTRTKLTSPDLSGKQITFEVENYAMSMLEGMVFASHLLATDRKLVWLLLVEGGEGTAKQGDAEIH